MPDSLPADLDPYDEAHPQRSPQCPAEIKKAFAFLCLTAAIVVATSCRAPAQQPPNIVLIISDDQGWTDYGFMGHPVIQTPRLDRLARESILFRRGYVPTALCRPSLMTLVTGHYAHRHGVTGNDPSPRDIGLDSKPFQARREALISYIDRLPTLPALLAQRGYLSHQSGKWWEGSFKRGGFTHGMTRGFPREGGRHGDDGLTIGREGLSPVTAFIDTAVTAGKPFFIWYAPFLPHLPHDPPQRLLQKYQDEGRPSSIAGYYAMCEWLDETVGQLLDELEHRGLRENTLIVYVTDNGWVQNPEGRAFAPRSKQSPYEGGVRTPILFSWPGRFRPADRPELVSSIDLVPTLLAVAGARLPADLPGLDLLPYLDEGKEIPRDTVFGEGFAHDIADLSNPEASLLYRWCIEGRWKLILTYGGQVNRYAFAHPRTERGPQLYDLTSDPHETSNQAPDHPRIVTRLSEKIRAWYPLHQQEPERAPDTPIR